MTSSQRRHLEPARSVIERLGGVDVVANVTRKDRTRVFRWMYPVERGGTGGLVPQRVWPRLLEYAAKNRIKLEPADFINGAKFLRR
jgi:hypothetical protein